MSGTDGTFDVAVYGGTPAGIAAAVAAARMGRTVALLDTHRRFGGMAASGLSKSDVEKREYIGGVFTDFVRRVRAHYVETYGADSESARLSYDGYYYEPSVAEAVFGAMMAEQPTLTLMPSRRLLRVHRDGVRAAAIDVADVESGAESRIEAKVFVDATYEGDLYAAAGAAFFLGRESRDAYNESLAGHIYYDYENGVRMAESTGAGDDRLPAWTYRLCLTTDPANGAALTGPPDGYDRSLYTPYFDDLEAGRLGGPKVFHAARGYYPAHFNTMLRALSVTEIPNGKVDVNINPRPLAFPFPEENAGYLAGDWDARQRIEKRHRDMTLGLLWFLQHDDETPLEHRRMARRYFLPRDEFADTDHFPWQLYVREARRLDGLYLLTQHDVAIGADHAAPPPIHDDTIAMGEFPIDNFPTRKRQPGDTIVLEGYLGMLGHLTRPYAIPYRAMIPKDVDGVIVPGAISATHVAYSTIRMEPTWMALGHAAGIAAHLAAASGCPARDVPMETLRDILRSQGQVVDAPV